MESFIGNAEAFPVLNRWDFFNHAGVSPLCGLAAAAMRRYTQQAETDVYLGTHWYADIEQLRVRVAKMINAHRDEIAFVKNTSEGISIVADGIDWQWGDVIVTANVEYPANVYPWMEVVRGYGAKLLMVEEVESADGARMVPTEKILEVAGDPRCRMVALSHVEFASGQRHDLARIGKFCHEHKKLFCVDAIQTIGII